MLEEAAIALGAAGDRRVRALVALKNAAVAGVDRATDDEFAAPADLDSAPLGAAVTVNEATVVALLGRVLHGIPANGDFRFLPAVDAIGVSWIVTSFR